MLYHCVNIVCVCGSVGVYSGFFFFPWKQCMVIVITNYLKYLTDDVGS